MKKIFGIFLIISISLSGTFFIGHDVKVKTNSDIDKMHDGGFYFGYNHPLASNLLDSKKLSIDIGTSLSANPMRNKTKNIIASVHVASLYFLPIYNIAEKINLSYKIGYNVFNSDYFKSKGGLLYGLSINFKISVAFTVNNSEKLNEVNII